MKIVGGKRILGETIVIEMENGKLEYRKVQTSNKNCPSYSTYFVNIGGKRVKVKDIERAVITDLNETERKMLERLQQIENHCEAKEALGGEIWSQYFSYASMFVRDVVGYDIDFVDGKVAFIAG